MFESHSRSDIWFKSSAYEAENKIDSRKKRYIFIKFCVNQTFFAEKTSAKTYQKSTRLL